MQKEISLSVSSRVIRPRSYSVTAVLLPTGKPQTVPKRNAQLPAPESPNRARMGRSKTRPSISPPPVLTSSSESTMNGKSVGITAEVQSVSPRVTYLIEISGLRSSSAMKKMLISTEIALRGEGSSAVRIFFRFAVTVPVFM